MKENVKDKQDHHFRFVRMGNLPALLPNATPLVMRFFAEMSKKRQRRVIVNLDNKKKFSISANFTNKYCNCNYPRISGKMFFQHL
jgi:hypothetical protein